MDIAFSERDLAFREDVQTFLRDEYPQDIKDKQNRGEGLDKEDIVRWHKALHRRGWTGVNWPVEYGGTGWSATQKYIFNNELAAANTPPLLGFNLKMLGPVIYTYGNEEQKKRFLPDILSLDVWWCQGYSEPGAGSDLASLKTAAVRDGDDYIVNGQKTWTTLAQYADWMFCLVRTNPDAAKPQQGISFLLLDMKSEGVEVRPITTLEGEVEVNEVFLTDVRVPVANRIGEENQGWTCAKMLLSNERTGIANVAGSKYEIKRLRIAASQVLAGDASLLQDAEFARKLADVEIDLTALEYSELRVLGQMAAGEAPGPESSLLKIRGTDITQSISELFVETAGYYAMPLYASAGDNVYPSALEFAKRVAGRYFNLRKVSIFGGSNEIQRNIIAKAVLGV